MVLVDSPHSKLKRHFLARTSATHCAVQVDNCVTNSLNIRVAIRVYNITCSFSIATVVVINLTIISQMMIANL